MKRITFILVGLAALLLATPAVAQGGSPPIPNPPAPDIYVLDTLNWMDAVQEREINTIARQLAAEGEAEIYVATLDDCGNDKTQYRRDIFNAWNIGSQKKNGGLLILVCWYGGDPSRRSVEVRTDERMQQVIPDALTAKTAEDNFVPAFKADQPGTGLVNMVRVFDDSIRHPSPANPLLAFISQYNMEAIGLGVAFLIVLIFAQINKSTRGNASGSDYSSGHYGGGGGDGGGGDGGGSSTGF